MVEWTGRVVATTVLRVLWATLNNLYTIPAYFGWMLLLSPLLYYNPQMYWTIEGQLFHWALSMVVSWMWTAGYTVMEAGDAIEPIADDECIVVANHQSTADVPTFMYLMDRHAISNKSLWIMEKIFMFTNFGAVSVLHGDFFIVQGKETRHQQPQLLRQHLHRIYKPRDRKWIILFPEGGFLRKRRATSKEFAKKNGFPILEHVTLPRAGALEAILDTLSPSAVLSQPNGQLTSDGEPKKTLKWLLDVTIAYPEGRPLDMQTIMGGWREKCHTSIYYRKYPIHEVPLESEQLTKWMYDRWSEKEKLLAEYYRTGQFPINSPGVTPDSGSPKCAPRLFEHSNLYFLLVHLFYIVSTYIQYCMISCLYSTITGVFSYFIS